MDVPNPLYMYYKMDTRTGYLVELNSHTPDNDVFVHLASSYSFSHPTMHTNVMRCGDSFTNGMVQGAELYNSAGKSPVVYFPICLNRIEVNQ